MPQITDPDIQRVKDLVKQRDIAGARKLLQSFQGERAAKMLTALNEKYPPISVPPPTIPLAPALDPNVDIAKALMQKGQYEEAYKLLMVSDDPRADVLLKRINEYQAAPVGRSEPAIEKPKKAPKKSSGCGSTLLALILLIGGALFCSNMSNNGQKIMEEERQERKDASSATFEFVCVWYLRGRGNYSNLPE
jgi:hypothetical protein